MKLLVHVAVVLCMAATPALAQKAKPAVAAGDYPNKSIRLVIPAAPGGGTDIIGRLIAQGLTDTWGQTVVVDNRGGAGGTAGMTIVAKQSAPDGYTMVLGSVGHLTFAPAIERNLGYDPQKDLAPITLAAVQPFVVAVSNSLPAKSIKELVALARAKPDSIGYGSGGSGSASHLSVELMMLEGGFKLLHVPYKGSNPALTAVMAGEIQVAFAGLQTVLPHSRAGKVRALAVTGATRAKIAPELPTIAEAGVPGYAFDVWYGLAFTGGTPRVIVRKTHAEVVRLIQAPDVSSRFAAAGVEPITNTPEAFAEMIRIEIPKWTKVARAAKLRVD
ncbi:MAG TPA: tripartite tricarboxylate transporter substrate-binding protein [Burkholderiales bacterium]|nr:tripartite tricarboxylate transporter substrate-binding protein [Burkholderiales bacterium]